MKMTKHIKFHKKKMGQENPTKSSGKRRTIICSKIHRNFKTRYFLKNTVLFSTSTATSYQTHTNTQPNSTNTALTLRI